jgi:hypothetical protein
VSDAHDEPSEGHHAHIASCITLVKDQRNPDETPHRHSSHSVLNNNRDNGKGKGRAVEYDRPSSTHRQTLSRSSSSIIDITTSESLESKESRAKIIPEHHVQETSAFPLVARDNHDISHDNSPPSVVTTNDSNSATRRQQSHRVPKPRSLLFSVHAHLGLEYSPTTQSGTPTVLSDQESEQEAPDRPGKLPPSSSASSHGENIPSVASASGALGSDLMEKDTARSPCDMDRMNLPLSGSNDDTEDTASAQEKSHTDIMAITRARLGPSKQQKMLNDMAVDIESTARPSLLERLESEKANAMSNGMFDGEHFDNLTG